MIPSLIDRNIYPSLSEEVYLNQASIGLIADPVVQAMHRFLDDSARHGNMKLTDEQEVALFNDLRNPAARLLRCKPDQLAITACASDILGQLPYWYNLHSEDEIILIESDFPAISRPWVALAEEDQPQICWVRDAPNKDLTEAIIRQISPQTRLILVGHVQYGTGSLVDVEALSAQARLAGADLIIDATQSAGVLEINGPTWQVSAVITSGYKWLGGHGGVAISYLSDALIQKTPVLAGWMGAPEPFEFDTQSARFAGPASKFTLSTMSYLSLTGLATALEHTQSILATETTSHVLALRIYLENNIKDTGWSSFNTTSSSSPIVSLAHTSADAPNVYQALLDNGIHTSQRNGRLRISLAPFVNSSDIDRLVSVLSLYD